jgi:hypothetical protein
MADPIGLSVASASIAAVQLVTRLHSISSLFFKSASFPEDLKYLETRYKMELFRLQSTLRMLGSDNPNAPSIPMHLFEELYLELRKQAVALESSQNETSSSSPRSPRIRRLRWAVKDKQDKRRFEDFIEVLKRYSDIIQGMYDIRAMTSTGALLSTPPERFVCFLHLAFFCFIFTSVKPSTTK